MKRLLLFAATLLVVLSTQARAASLDDPGVPHTINLQSLIYDANGKITQKDRVDIAVKILDADHNVIFDEDHNDVLVVKGAVNIEIGSEGGGVPLEILDPSTGTKFVDVMVTGSDPWDLMPLGAVPYAMWAERALTVSDDAIESRHIKDGTIKAEDIDPLAFSDIQGQAAEGQIPTTITTDAELNTHISAAIAHPGSAITIKGPFANFVAFNVQEAIQKIDIKILDEYANRINGTKELMAMDVTILDSEISRSGDTIYGELSFYTDETLVNQTLSLSPATGDIAAEGELSMLGGLVTVEKDDNTNEALLLMEDVNGNEKVRLSGGDGTITLNGNVVITGLVDGVDVSNLSGDLLAHTNATTAHGSDGTVVGATTLSNAISDHAALTQGVHGLSSTPGNAIVGTTETQTLTNKTLTSPTINGGTISNAAISSSSFSGDLADNTVQTNDIQSGAVTTDKILDGTITAADIGSQAVGSDEIVDNVITADDIGSQAVASDEIADGTILVGDLNAPSFVSWDQNAGDDLTNVTSFGGDVSGAYNNIQLVADSVGSAEITADAVGVSEIGTDAVQGDEIATDAVSSSEISKDAVGSEEIANNEILVEDIFQNEDNATSLDYRYVNEGGDTMTGALNVPTPGVKLPNPVNVGNTLDDHETRIDALEKGAPVEVNDVPAAIRPLSYCGFASNAFVGPAKTARCLNFGSAQDLGAQVGCNTGVEHVLRVTFAQPFQDAAYTPLITQTGVTPRIQGVMLTQTTHMDICYDGFGGGVEYVIFGNY